MRIIILHRVPFEKVQYDMVIDHEKNDVIYFGPAASLKNIPQDLPCERVIVDAFGDSNTFKVVERLQRFAPIDHLVALSEFDLLVAADLRETFNIQGPKVSEVLKVRDKVVMKQLIKTAGMAHPKFFRLSEGLAGRELEFPLILKPVDGATSTGVELIHNRAHLLGRIERIPASELHNYEVEEFIQGEICHFDGWLKNGEIQDFVASRYVNTCLDYLNGAPLGSFQILDDGNRLKVWAQKIVGALGMQNGAFHLEAILANDKIYFLEIGHRVGGAGVAQTFESKTGVNLYHAHLVTFLGLANNLPQHATDEMFGWFVFPGHHLRGEWSVGGAEYLLDPRHIEISSLRLGGSNKSAEVSYLADRNPVSGLIRTANALAARNLLNFIFKKVRVRAHLMDTVSA